MKLEAEVGGRRHEVVIDRQGSELSATLDGTPVPLDARPMEGFFLSLLIDGKVYEVTVEPDGQDWKVQIGIESYRVSFLDPLRLAGQDPAAGAGMADRRAGGRGVAASLMPGKVVRVLVKVGDEVAEGEDLLVVEAMKMENAVVSPRSGRVLEVRGFPGETVEAGTPLVIIG